MKTLEFTPTVPHLFPEAAAALAEPLFSHRSERFTEIFRRTSELLKALSGDRFHPVIARGTGTAASPQSPGMIVDGGATVVMEGSGFVMDNAEGQPDHRGRPWLRVDGGSTFKVNGHVFLGENDKATGTVDVVNGSTFISDNQSSDRGMIVSPSTGADMTITFDSASTNRAYLMRVGRGGKVTYKGGSVLE